MALQGITFDNQSVAARDHGALFAGILKDGIVAGCDLSYTGATLSMATGYIIACGRLIRNTAAQSVNVTGTSGYSQVILTVDVSNDGTFSFSSVNAVTPSFPALTQEDINDGVSTTYQMELCVCEMDGSGITSIYRSCGRANSRQISWGTADPSGGEDGDIYLKLT